MRVSVLGGILLTGTTTLADDLHGAPGGNDADTGAADAPFAANRR